ncbi:hypothetical protein [Massilia genomosp. 1]|uniref:Uncharacterized protein n=1 Tax=Massilia genomosp. 1 TaxID=2609280 RepID=A0ABX0MDE1_9BURK|nr:hypothetical protein [Massilia genomosp. 1]NHZ60781.1 hypothetical protein [Massilia genomosp. 1]
MVQLTIQLYDNDKHLGGSWLAYNKVHRTATLTHIPDRSYTIQDKAKPFPHPADPNGSLGKYGIIGFFVPGHEGTSGTDKIQVLASSSCPADLKGLCTDLKKAAADAFT